MNFRTLREIRKQKEIRLKKMCEDTGISPPTIIDLEKGTGNITIKNLKKIVDYLGIPLWKAVLWAELGDFAEKELKEMIAHELLKRIEFIKEE